MKWSIDAMCRLNRCIPRWRLIALSLAAFLIGANAMAAGKMRVVTLALAPVPLETTVEIRLPDDAGTDDLGIWATLGQAFAKELTRRRYVMVDGDGELILRFSPDEPSLAGMPRGPSGGSVAPLILTAADNRAQDADFYRLRVSVARHRRPPLWTGLAEQSVAGADRRAVFVELAKALMARWAESYPPRGQ